MVTARLIDNIWATRKAEALNGSKLMLAEVIGGTRSGERMGGGGYHQRRNRDRVIITMGSSARRMLKGTSR